MYAITKNTVITENTHTKQCQNKLVEATIARRFLHAVLHRNLCFTIKRPIAVISGAGIAGLATAITLVNSGYRVVIFEKRDSFSRSNIINLSSAVQRFLKKYHLLETFEESVAARIKEHRYLLVDRKKEFSSLGISKVADLNLDESISFTSENLSLLFKEDGIYSAPIDKIQTFLAEKALDLGVHIFGRVDTEISVKNGCASVALHNEVFQPDLFFVAEGAHAKTLSQVDITTQEVANRCSNENWIFGNFSYSGDTTFVISIIDTSGPSVEIANVIFNAKSQQINIAVSCKETMTVSEIEEKMTCVARVIFEQQVFPVKTEEVSLLNTVEKPVHISNQICSTHAKKNIFVIGDAAGNSSPLAGLGGTLGLTFVPQTVEHLIEKDQTQSKDTHETFNHDSSAYVTAWMTKSDTIKGFCLGQHEKQRKDRNE